MSANEILLLPAANIPLDVHSLHRRSDSATFTHQAERRKGAFSFVVVAAAALRLEIK